MNKEQSYEKGSTPGICNARWVGAGTHDSVDFVAKATQGDRSFGVEQLKLIKSVDTILLGKVS